MAPRRYGKTSLIVKVAREMQIPHCSIDLLAAFSEEYVRDQIVDKVSKLVFDLMPSLNKAKDKLIQIFKKMQPEISMGAFGQRLTLKLSKSPLSDITDLLLRFDETAKTFNKQTVIFIDEFQQISKLKNHHSIEASIRHAVERSENVAYIFSGSHQHLLEQMFGDQGRPLYRLCQIMNIDRMSQADYTKHLQTLAKRKWNNPLSTEALEEIFIFTECHPFYVNTLCQALWESEALPTPEFIKDTWRKYVETQRALISHDVMELSVNQRKVLSALSIASQKEIQSAEFTAPLKLSTSSVWQAIETLKRKGLIYKSDQDYYHILDPAMKYYLTEILWSTR